MGYADKVTEIIELEYKKHFGFGKTTIVEGMWARTATEKIMLLLSEKPKHTTIHKLLPCIKCGEETKCELMHLKKDDEVLQLSLESSKIAKEITYKCEVCGTINCMTYADKTRSLTSVKNKEDE